MTGQREVEDLCKRLRAALAPRAMGRRGGGREGSGGGPGQEQGAQQQQQEGAQLQQQQSGGAAGEVEEGGGAGAALDACGGDAAEAAALSRSILVNVTAFFRDRPVWDAVADHLRTLVDTLDPLVPLRMWVPGCASGEEAYTVAMLGAEALGPAHGDLTSRMKVFATDLDERSLAVARRARYSGAAVDAIPSTLRERWMRPVDRDWEVVPSLRECVVIAQHNVAFDPPFPRVHLISLRNTLI